MPSHSPSPFLFLVRCFVGSLLCVLLPVQAQAQAQTQAQLVELSDNAAVGTSQEVAALLAKMASGSQRVNYQGTFTYQHKDNPALQSFRISHWVDEGVQYERLQHLNGPEREISRAGRDLNCATLSDRLLLGGIDSDRLVKLGQLYRFELRGQERVAGRMAWVLLAIPQDAYRYSYFLSIDNETGLVLKSWLVDEAARPLERYQFVALELNPDVSQLKAQPMATLHRDAEMDVPSCNPSHLEEPRDWQLTGLPPGFAFVGQKRVRDRIDMLMYTDGLASFSVFIEPGDSSAPEGIAQRGATLAVMDQLNLEGQIYRVTVVGEIPVASAQHIAQQITRQQVPQATPQSAAAQE